MFNSITSKCYHSNFPQNMRGPIPSAPFRNMKYLKKLTNDIRSCEVHMSNIRYTCLRTTPENQMTLVKSPSIKQYMDKLLLSCPK